MIVAAAEATGTPLQKYISQIEGQTLAISLAGPQAKMFTEKLAAMQHVVGATEEAFREQTTGINAAGHAWNQFQQQIVTTAQKFGDQLIPILMRAAEQMKPLWQAVMAAVDGFGRLPQPVQTTVVVIGALLVALSPVLLALGTLASGIAALLPLWPVLAVGMSLLLSPIALVVAAIVGLGVVWYTWGDDLKRIVREVYVDIKLWLNEKLFQVFTYIGEKVAAVKGFFKDLYDAVVGGSYVPDLVEGIATEFSRLDAVMVVPARNAVGMVAAQFAALQQQVTSLLMPTLEMVRGDSGFWGVKKIIEAGATSIDKFTVSMRAAATETKASSGIFGSFFSGLSGSVQSLWKGMSGGTGISGLFGNLGKGIMDGLGNIVSGGMSSLISSGVGLAVTRLKKLFGGLFGGGEAKEVRRLREQIQPLIAEAQAAGISVQGIFSARKVKDFEAAMAAVQRQLQRFTAEQEADAARLEAAIQKYGFAFEQLGPAFQQQRLDDLAKELIEDWRVLVNSGIQVDLVNEKMAESINAYLKTALRTGMEVPAAMRPILDRLLQQGLLTDEAGNKIMDLEATGLHFAETMTQGFDRVVEKLNELIARLAAASAAIADMPTVPEAPDGPAAPSEPSPDGFLHGTPGLGFMDFRGGRRATLHGREAVVPEGRATEFAARHANMAGVERRLDRLQRSLEDRLPLMIRDAILVAGR